MFFSVLLCFLVIAVIPLCRTHYSQETRYECGPHGKFEYCIDGIPGCVIGCHCHPGYYFDTDTKICEPNIKLTQDFRRQYLPEPTRVNAPPANNPTVTDAIPTPTAINNIEGKANEAAKDTDELGNWLYNQFFKTIENQVINNSNNTDTDNKQIRPPTRRSGGGRESVLSKPKRRARKSMRARKKKKHPKVHGLRRKLLRITEDDSLFDSDSEDSGTEESSGSETASESETEENSDDSSGKKTDKDDKCEKDDHGHKKVIIFNRRPKPPLPSFIFLPNMDTPYYPPIGLPPPPPMPMYPMVPVPPMGPPMYPFPAPPRREEEINSTTGSPATTSSTPEVTATSEASSSTTTTEAPSSPPPGSERRNRFEKHRMKKPIQDKYMLRANEPGKKPKLTHGRRSKLVQQLRDKMKEKRKNRISSIDALADELLDAESPVNEEDLKDINSQELAVTPAERSSQKNTRPQSFPKLDDVDFKYLSELIHRVNQSEANSNVPPLPLKNNEDLKEPQKLKPLSSRRNYDPYNIEPDNIQLKRNHHRTLQRQVSDDVYYTNLGRQIASMIRNGDSNLGNQMDQDTEQANRQVPFHSVLNENSYAPRSFWERSVRSPLRHMSFSNYLDKSRTLKHSNDKKLLHIENEVEEFAATTHRPLSLRDIENILNRIEKAQLHLSYKEPFKFTHPQEEPKSLNINLLPKFVRSDNNYRTLYNAPEKVEYITEHYQAPLPPKIFIEIPPKIFVEMPPNHQITPNVTKTTSIREPDRNAIDLPFIDDFWMYSNNQNAKPVHVVPANNTITGDSYARNQIHNTNQTSRPLVTATRPENNIVKKPVEYLQFRKSMPIVKQMKELKFLADPAVDFHTLNYFTGNRHHYTLEHASYPLHITTFKRQAPHGVETNPSYFHHALEHFHFFD